MIPEKKNNASPGDSDFICLLFSTNKRVRQPFAAFWGTLLMLGMINLTSKLKAQLNLIQ